MNERKSSLLFEMCSLQTQCEQADIACNDIVKVLEMKLKLYKGYQALLGRYQAHLTFLLDALERIDIELVNAQMKTLREDIKETLRECSTPQ